MRCTEGCLNAASPHASTRSWLCMTLVLFAVAVIHCDGRHLIAENVDGYADTKVSLSGGLNLLKLLPNGGDGRKGHRDVTNTASMKSATYVMSTYAQHFRTTAAWDATLPCEGDVVLTLGLRNLSEADGWLRWIIENYHREDISFVSFLHESARSWHADITDEAVCGASSTRKLSFKKYLLWDIADAWTTKYKTENEMGDWLYRCFFGTDALSMFRRVNTQAQMCCGVMSVDWNDVRRVPFEGYLALYDKMQATTHHPWAWILERSWENIFRYFDAGNFNKSGACGVPS